MAAPWEEFWGPRRDVEEWAWRTYGRPAYGYEIFRGERQRPPWGIPPRPPGTRRRGGPRAAPYAIMPSQLEGLITNPRVRSWIAYVLGEMGLYPETARPTYYGLGAPAARRPTTFFFPPFIGGY